MATQLNYLGKQDYEPVWRHMQQYTDTRGAETADQIWMVEHQPVFTVGMNGDMQHLLNPGNIPVVHIDRGGQVTYHGPGQMVVYPLINLRNKAMGVRDLVTALENVVIDTLSAYGCEAHARRDAPGVYVGAAKIASLGLRIRKGCSYHGLAFNVDMDLSPFRQINPCGFAGLDVIDLAHLGIKKTLRQVAEDLQAPLMSHLRIDEFALDDQAVNHWA